MSTKYNVGWLKDEQNQIFIPFTYAKSVKLDDSNKTLDITVSTVDEHTNALKGQNDRITALEKGDTPAGSAAQTVGKLTIGNSSFNGSEDVLVTAKDLGITGALVYRGVSSTEITNGGTELPKIGKDYIALSDLNPGNIVLYKTKGGVIYQEFVWTGEAWELLGDEGSYALKTIEIVAGDGLINAGSGNTSLRDNIIISVNPGEGLTITSTDKKLALKPINPSVVNEDIAIDTNGITSFILPSVTVDTYGRVTSITNKTIQLNDVTDKVNNLINNVSGLTSQLKSVIDDIAGDSTQNDKIVPRINTLETRTKYLYAADDKDTAFAICDGDGDIALEIQTDGKTRGFDFITVDGNSVNENEARIEALEGKLQNITVQSASGNATAFIDSISQNNEGTIIATKKNIPVFNGATNQNNGTSGLVTQPLRADRTKFLCGDGTWKTVSTDDKKVNQTPSRTNKNYPLLISTNENPNGQDLSAYYNSGVTMNPSTKEIIANNFKGGLNTNGKNIQLTENVNYGASITSANDGILVFEEISGSLIPEDGTHGYVLTSNQGKPNWQENIAAGIQINPIENNRIYVTGTFDAQYLYYNNNVYIEDNVLMGAAWNDYAEYRICRDNYKAGQVVCENGDDTLSIATERLQPGAEIVSDTFGFAIGLTEEATCPIAVSGRVLAYTYEPRAEFSAGDAVCAGPNGTVSKMTREEIREYPERIIGTVSAIPNYETWNDKVIVNNRIWIKIK